MDVPFGRRRAFVGMVAALLIFGGACTAGENGPGASTAATTDASTTSSSDTSARQFRLGMAVHVDEPIELSGGFWAIAALGALEAADASNVDLEMRGDYDPSVPARMVETLIADGVDGLIVSLADPEAMKPALDLAAEAGIPVITINSGIDFYLETEALTHVGQSELAAGRAVGDRFNSMELSGDVLCLVQESNNVGLEERCSGVEATYGGGDVIRVREDLTVTQAAEAMSLLSRELEAGAFAAVVTLDGFYGLIAVDAVEAAQVDAVVTTFDFDPSLVDDLRAGDIAFTIDQRPYLQGHTPVQLLAEYLSDGTAPERATPVETGPFLIDAANVDAVVENAKGMEQRIAARFSS